MSISLEIDPMDVKEERWLRGLDDELMPCGGPVGIKARHDAILKKRKSYRALGGGLRLPILLLLLIPLWLILDKMGAGTRMKSSLAVASCAM